MAKVELATPDGNMSGMEVRDNPVRSRYELLDGERVVGVADYVDDDGVLLFPHTEIDPSLRGRGLGAILVDAALRDVRRKGRTIVPACWFVAEFVDRHPEFQDLLAA
jgi:predicted GNAT family acetyltransferase